MERARVKRGSGVWPAMLNYVQFRIVRAMAHAKMRRASATVATWGWGVKM